MKIFILLLLHNKHCKEKSFNQFQQFKNLWFMRWEIFPLQSSRQMLPHLDNITLEFITQHILSCLRENPSTNGTKLLSFFFTSTLLHLSMMANIFPYQISTYVQTTEECVLARSVLYHENISQHKTNFLLARQQFKCLLSSSFLPFYSLRRAKKVTPKKSFLFFTLRCCYLK